MSSFSFSPLLLDSNCQWSIGKIGPGSIVCDLPFGVCASISIVVFLDSPKDGRAKKLAPNTRVAGQRETPKAHRELKGDKGRWGSSTGGGYSCLIACPTCRLDVSRCPIYSCSPSSLSLGRLPSFPFFFLFLFSCVFVFFFFFLLCSPLLIAS